ncbi:contactin [Nilaparvata lugens]|uniref:contactin n=1 Tax=Nilaparvata lugens TaxID=108931 RepID=UPI00193E562B|nr:contactin [Nilaparvata lugens]
MEKYFLILLATFELCGTQITQEGSGEWTCPQHWHRFQNSCYRFIKSPLRNRNDARRNCQAYVSDLVSINNLEELGFIVNRLIQEDPQHRRWYIGAHEQSPGYWVNEGDSTALTDMDSAFLPEQGTLTNQPKPHLAFSYSYPLRKWGVERVTGEEMLLYICEAPIANVYMMVTEDRTFQYGLEVDDPLRIPMGPYFIKQPVNVVFDLSKKGTTNDISLSCLAAGYPTPTYEWFREDYENDRLVATQIDPLQDKRYTVSGGSLLINEPRQDKDRGSYHCKATNKYGTIISELATLSFGFIAEFNMKRSPQDGKENWGKAIFCDPPQNFPGVKYYWVRDYFPNFVEEDKRVFVSYDGALYFSAIENIDQGNYSCIVQSQVSDTGRNGPFFPLRVNPHCKNRKPLLLLFFNVFSPVPSYNWTRKGAPLPRNAVLSNYNRVLTLPHVQVEDQGEYVCRVYNDRAADEKSVVLSIKAEPNFTIPLTDKHMDNKGELTWTCEAFGIPDVDYTWFRNGKPLTLESLPPDERGRYLIQDNVLTIKNLNPEIDPAMYQCRASNILKMKYSSAQLRVLSVQPSFKKRPLEAETYAAEGGNITMICNPEAAPRPKFVWKKDDATLGSTGRRRILENGNLIISPVSRDDEGMYTCIASNQYGQDQSQGRLIVLRGPTLVEWMESKITTAVQRDVVLRCQAASEEVLDLAYMWTHNGLRISNNEFKKTRVRNDGGTLEIHNVTLAEAGDYECIVKSAVGRISMKTSVTVEGPPGPPGGVQVDVMKTSAMLQWTDGASNGRPITHYTVSCRTNWNSSWFNVAENITANEISRYNGRKEATIENVLSPWSTYEFRVIAANMLGYGIPSAPSPSYNTPPDKPYVAPTNIGGGGGKIGDLTITWKTLDRKHQNGPGIYYKVFWRLSGHETEFQSLDLKSYGNVGVTVVRIELQNYYTKYDVKVQAANSIGMGPESQIETIYSAEDMPQVAPQQVSARSFNSTSLNVSWVPIDMSRERIRGKLIGHRLKYWKKDTKEEDSVYYLSRSTRPWALIVGLQPNIYYFVKVMAYNAAGEGPESERFLEKTFRKAPQKPPTSVHAYYVNPTTVRVVWRYVTATLEEEPVIGYKIRVWEVDQDMSRANDTYVPVGSKLEAYVSNLSVGKAYLMRVLAYSNGGDGRMSSPPLRFQMGSFNKNSAESTISEIFTILVSSFMLIYMS